MYSESSFGGERHLEGRPLHLSQKSREWVVDFPHYGNAQIPDVIKCGFFPETVAEVTSSSLILALLLSTFTIRGATFPSLRKIVKERLQPAAIVLLSGPFQEKFSPPIFG